ncbi:MAG: sigma-70 family RNA polymerase sigma factor [Planctomycetes bacterium]|nr:sigma-70 family RNA polymerase sigma factor [Planctomycetota bacterium]
MRNPDPPDDVPRVVIDRAEDLVRDRGLVAAFRAGDGAAFEEIVHLHRRRLFGIALRRTGNSTIAEDAVQVALVQAWKHLPRMDGEIDLTAWLTTVVQNAALDQIRRDRRQDRLAQRAHDAVAEQDDRRGADRPAEASGGDLERDELGKILLEGVRALPEPYRVALDLFHVQGLSVEEIARTLSMNENTVKSHLARGRGLLRRRLGSALERGGWL